MCLKIKDDTGHLLHPFLKGQIIRGQEPVMPGYAEKSG